MSELRYKAFISYSHQDEAWGRWLQKVLEGYRIPGRLVGQEGRYGKIPARLSPIFRDREDLSSAANLSRTVREELAQSETLIVICSPSSVRSNWVNEEVSHFRSMGRADRIHALVVDGDPQAADSKENCFPPELLAAEDGNRIEPLAADPRKWADGKLLAKLKLVSGILGIRLDDLRRRDLQRRHRIMMMSVGAAVTVALIMAVLAVLAISARKAAENRREHAESLVGYMVGDLKIKLDEVGRLDILEGLGGRVGKYLQTLDPNEVTDESLVQQARVWRQLGQVSKDQGNLADAHSAFAASRDILAELHRRNPGVAEYVFELGNAEYWVAVVHLNQGKFDSAGEAFQAYLVHANHLNEIEPGNPDWLMEQSYAHINIAALIKRSGNSDVGLAVSHSMAAVEINRQVIDLAPENKAYWSEYSNNMAWLADIQLLTCDLAGALNSRQEQVEVARKQMELAPGNINYKRRFAYSLSGHASVAERVGLVEIAANNYLQSRDILTELSVVEPSNVDFRFEYLMRNVRYSVLAAESGDLETAMELMESTYGPLLDVLETESFENLRHHKYWISYLLSYSDMNWRSGRYEASRSLMSDALSQLEALLENGARQDSIAEQLLDARYLSWQQEGHDLFESGSFTKIVGLLDGEDTSCDMQANLARHAVIGGDIEMAQEVTERLTKKGYYEPQFIRFCRQYEFCE